MVVVAVKADESAVSLENFGPCRVAGLGQMHRITHVGRNFDSFFHRPEPSTLFYQDWICC